MKPLHVAMLAHSTNPRGGVVHALELAEAMHALGHRVSLMAPDVSGRGFFRTTRCESVSVRARAVRGGVAELVRQRVLDYLAHFDRVGTDGIDVWHAQDSISANALATLEEQGRIAGFVRTVHHLDRFDDPQVMALQRRGYESARQVLCVSRQWRDILAREHGIDAWQVANGVDTQRYRREPQAHDDRLRRYLGLHQGHGPVLLAVGGIEARKNTLAILRAFIALRATRPDAQLVVAGGASLLDHRAEHAAFDAPLQASGLRVARGAGPHDARADVIVTGALPDADMPSLYRLADALLFPSLKEGFGLVVLEALASGTPAVVSRIAPFTEHLDGSVVSWCDPLDVDSIVAAGLHALDPTCRADSIRAAQPLLARYGWAASAAHHIELYRRVALAPTQAPPLEPLHA